MTRDPGARSLTYGDAIGELRELGGQRVTVSMHSRVAGDWLDVAGKLRPARLVGEEGVLFKIGRTGSWLLHFDQFDHAHAYGSTIEVRLKGGALMRCTPDETA